MNKTRLKSLAQQARRNLLGAVRRRAGLWGLTAANAGRAGSSGKNGGSTCRHDAELQAKLLAKIEREGLEPVFERAAYAWFNRFVALEFLELNGFSPDRWRDLGRREPEMLADAAGAKFSDFKPAEISRPKPAHRHSAAQCRSALIARCNELHRLMPALFDPVDDEQEALLPDELFGRDSVIQKTFDQIDEDDWRQVEIIGWLHQFYFSEKKQDVLRRKVRSADIPAATQLFTPDWIVRYMTQNSLGRLWLENNPHSRLTEKMEYYITPAEEYEDPKCQLQNPESAISPEAIRVFDPACGSGHILVEAYELLRAIYLERGYDPREVPRLILEKNLYGLELDERAARLAGFALLMKARRDDCRLLSAAPAPRLNIAVVPDSSLLEDEPDVIGAMFLSGEPVRDDRPVCPGRRHDKTRAGSPLALPEPNVLANLSGPVDHNGGGKPSAQADAADLSANDVINLLNLFAQGRMRGSLIRIPPDLEPVIHQLEKAVAAKLARGSVFEKKAARQLEPFVRAARMLSQKYDCVVANPPYLAARAMDADLKAFAAREFPAGKADLFAMFIERSLELTNTGGHLGFMTPFVWMFISSYEKLRRKLIDEHTFTTLVELEYSGFAEATVPICTFTLAKKHVPAAAGSFIRLADFRGPAVQAPKTLEAIRNPACGWFYRARPADFKKIPGSPLAYWLSDRMRAVFEKSIPLGRFAPVRQGMATSDNDRFLRLWFEVSRDRIGFGCRDRRQARDSNRRWFPYNKGGEFRKWYGNNDFLVDFENDGREVLAYAAELYGSPTRTIKSLDQYFKPSVTWSFVSSSYFGVRRSDAGFVFDVGGSSVFPPAGKMNLVTGFLCSKLAFLYLRAINPTLNFQAGSVALLPIPETELARIKTAVEVIVEEAVAIARADWDSFEISWDFRRFPLLELRSGTGSPATDSVAEAFGRWNELTARRIRRMRELETENNRLFIKAYGLEEEISPETPPEQITLARADAEKDARRLISYFIGCRMGRYSLDEEGLIFAGEGNAGFDPSRYGTFPADPDGIVPVTDLEWFAGDAARQFEKFLRVAFITERTEGTEHKFNRDGGDGQDKVKAKILSILSIPDNSASQTQNMEWVAARLGRRAGETSLETIRRYFSASFYKDHLRTYRKQPIYWLFSSGREKAFECLVYLHRYDETTLARIRDKFVAPLQAKIAAAIRQLEARPPAATPAGRRARKDLARLRKKQTELAAFEEKLRRSAELRISLDLDDGVRVNYARFGDLLAPIKTTAKNL